MQSCFCCSAKTIFSCLPEDASFFPLLFTPSVCQCWCAMVRLCAPAQMRLRDFCPLKRNNGGEGRVVGPELSILCSEMWGSLHYSAVTQLESWISHTVVGSSSHTKEHRELQMLEKIVINHLECLMCKEYFRSTSAFFILF